MASATVAVISASFGSGHDFAAADLSRRLQARGVNVHRHDFVDLLGPRLGPLTRSGYARQLTYAPVTWGWTLQLMRHPRAVEACASACIGAVADRLHAVLDGADVVVSTYPLASLALGSLRRHGLAPPVVTFLTDLSVHPLWVSSGVDLHLAPNVVAAAQARAAGAHAVSLVAPAVDRHRFRPLDDDERVRVRQRYGLPVDGRLALISSGSWAVGSVAATARDVARTGEATPVIACGRNEDLRRRMARRGFGPALGWIDEMPALIAACDVVVTNAGGMTGLEAIACGVPLIAYRPLPGHGVTNAVAMGRTGLGVRAEDLAQLAKCLADPWPATFTDESVPRPIDIFGYPDPVEPILECLASTPGPQRSPTVADVTTLADVS